jgi:hypothetical protein
MRVYQKGQILLIVVLVMTIALTVGLSIATKTITTVRTTAEGENSQRAFSAAEAGIEQALQNRTSSTGTFTNNTSYQTSVATVGGQDFLVNNGAPVLKDEGVDIWFSTYPTYASPWTGTVTVYWGRPGDTCNANEAINTMAALEMVLISGTRANPQAGHTVVDPCGPPINRTSANRFELIPPGGGTISGQTFAFRKTITVTSGLIMRIVPLYASTRIAIRGCDGGNGNCNSLPAQGTQIVSVGTADNTQRKIVGFQENPKLPVPFFPFIIFSPR